MDKQEIISQGYLEAYLTGDLSKEEMQDVEALITSDAETRAEYYKLEKLLELMAFHTKLTPSPVLKRLIMEDKQVMGNFKERTVSTGGWKYSIAASIAVALLSAVSAIYFFGKWKATDSELSLLIAQNIEMAERFNKVNNELGDLRQHVAVLISPDYQRIILGGTDNAPDSKAVIYWNGAQEKVFLNSYTLASLPVNQQYQLWALIDGKPVDAGVFDAEEGSFQIMKNIASADAFAVTIEPKGGSESPTLSTMQVLGKVEA